MRHKLFIIAFSIFVLIGQAFSQTNNSTPAYHERVLIVLKKMVDDTNVFVEALKKSCDSALKAKKVAYRSCNSVRFELLKIGPYNEKDSNLLLAGEKVQKAYLNLHNLLLENMMTLCDEDNTITPDETKRLDDMIKRYRAEQNKISTEFDTSLRKFCQTHGIKIE